MNATDRSELGGRAVFLAGLLVLLSLVALRFAWKAGLVQEVVARHAVLTPVLTMDLRLGSQESHSSAFYLKYSGRYSVSVDLELRRGPQGADWATKTFWLQGSAEIFDAVGTARLQRKFSIVVNGDEVGATLLEFDTKDVGMGEKRLVLLLTLGPDFTEHYAKGTLRIRKLPRLAVSY